jgi:hypothetical protein
MDYLFQNGGKSKTKSKSSKSKTSTKKGGNFLGDVGELVSPTGWEGFATAAGLFAIDRADAALRRGKSEKKSEKSSANKGGSTKKTSSKKGGNFLGAVGELVAPTGWEGFATAAGLLAIDRADAALRRGKSTKSTAKKGGMKGGNEYDDEATRILETSNQDIVNKFQQNLSESYKMGKQGDYERVDLDIELRKKINERQRLLPLVSDTNIKKKLKSSIKRLKQTLYQEDLKNYRAYKNISKTNNPNRQLNWN